MMDHSSPILDSEISEQRTVEDASESLFVIELEIVSKQQNGSQSITIYSSLATISAVCDKTLPWTYSNFLP